MNQELIRQCAKISNVDFLCGCSSFRLLPASTVAHGAHSDLISARCLINNDLLMGGVVNDNKVPIKKIFSSRR